MFLTVYMFGLCAMFIIMLMIYRIDAQNEYGEKFDYKDFLYVFVITSLWPMFIIPAIIVLNIALKSTLEDY